MIEDPCGPLAELLEKHRHAQRGLFLRETAEFAKRFHDQHGIDLRFDPAAAEAVVALAETEGRTVHTICDRLLKDFPYGLRLILKHTGKQEFTVTESMISDPDGELSRLVLESYREADKAHPPPPEPEPEAEA
jgi:hypothetical protein